MCNKNGMFLLIRRSFGSDATDGHIGFQTFFIRVLDQRTFGARSIREECITRFLLTTMEGASKRVVT